MLRKYIVFSCLICLFKMINLEDITWPHGDMKKFHSFAALVKYFSNTRREILYLQTTMYFLYIIFVIHNIFGDFPKILQNLSEGQTNVCEHFPKISEDRQILSKTSEEDPKMFWSYTNKFMSSYWTKMMSKWYHV